MEIWHRVSFGHKDNIEYVLSSNLKFVKNPIPGGGFLVTFLIKESDPLWPLIDQLIKEKQLPDFLNSVFNNSEILEAEWVRLQPVFEKGYPQPEDDWDKITYEDECPKCGIGYRQKAPFHIANDPKMGKNDFLSLCWTYALFCTPKILQILQSEKIQGYEIWPAIIHKTNEPSKTVSQLIIHNIAKPALAEEDKLQPETCSQCGITKYLYHRRGYMHLKRDALYTNVDMQLTNEWFKSGFREILISNRLAKLIIDNKWRGVSLKPTLMF